MTLATHAIVGAAVARLFPSQPLIAFCAAFASHFVLDAIPHWDYQLRSKVRDPNDPLKNDLLINKAFFFDLVKIGVDCALGFGLSLLLFSASNWSSAAFVFMGACGGVLPDALQFAYFKIRRQPLTSLQRFHIFVHTKNHLEHPVLGIALQVTIVFFITLLITNY